LKWLSVEPRIRRHWKVQRLERALDIERGWTHVVSLLLWAAEDAEDGDLSRLSNDALASVMELDGVAAEANLLQVLKDCGLVDLDGRIHDWQDYVGRHRGAAERIRRWRERNPNAVKADNERRRARADSSDPVRTDLVSGSRRNVTERFGVADRIGQDRTGTGQRENQGRGGAAPEPGPCVECVVALSFLNELAGLDFPVNKGTTRLLHARHQEYTLRDVKRVIRVKTSEWLPDSKMRGFLRPRTLFGPENFAQYVGQPDPDEERLMSGPEGGYREHVCRGCRKRMLGNERSKVRCDSCQDAWESANL
jgi:uncharacterized phage protein (TIGR02220 family)